MYSKPFCCTPDGSRLSGLLDVLPAAPVISLVGGGGKTSTMVTLASELAARDRKVILTTTTNIMPFTDPLPQGVFCSGTLQPNGKLGPIENPALLKASCDHLIIEADGSRGLPVKVPATHEPVILAETDLVIAVLGLSGIGKPIARVCHRIPLVCEFLQKGEEEAVTVEDAARILTSSRGLRKDVALLPNCQYAIVLNQADGPRELEHGRQIASLVNQYTKEAGKEEIPLLLTTYRKSHTV